MRLVQETTRVLIGVWSTSVSRGLFLVTGTLGTPSRQEALQGAHDAPPQEEYTSACSRNTLDAVLHFPELSALMMLGDVRVRWAPSEQFQVLKHVLKTRNWSEMQLVVEEGVSLLRESTSAEWDQAGAEETSSLAQNAGLGKMLRFCATWHGLRGSFA